MRIRNLVRDIIINNYLDKPFNVKDIFAYIADNKIDVEYTQVRNAITGMARFARCQELIHVKKDPQSKSYYLTTKKIYQPINIKPRQIIRDDDKEKQVVYLDKYSQLIGDADFIQPQIGITFKGFDAPSGRIIRARDRVFVGCTLEMI
jgi:hypothetical protein